ncbi:hypothetical protein F7734_53595 [Scytonema sp. UIC 10036]|nr:hypothetical protein [Scytonema sp. UIC 10036]MUH00643.1 hypothetical protein [Scytonema sp. UIC 10036]
MNDAKSAIATTLLLVGLTFLLLTTVKQMRETSLRMEVYFKLDINSTSP